MTGQPIEQTFGMADFTRTPPKSGLFKMAARRLVRANANATEREKLALKY